MIKQLILGLSLFVGTTFSASLMELLNSVQNLVTEYETTGKALEHPYIYAQLTSYYKYGRLYAAYAMDKQATSMLSLASCAALPFDCKAYSYFLKKISYSTYIRVKLKYPVLLGKVQAAYNAYASWWLKKHFEGGEIYQTYKNLENVLKEDFAKYWESFLTAAPKPVIFKILRDPCKEDLFLTAMLTTAYYQGWIRKVTFYGDWTAYRYLYVNGYLPPTTYFVPYDKCTKYNFIYIY